MSVARKELQEALCHYATDTLIHIHTVRDFCEEFSTWSLWRETELDRMMDIKDGVDTLDLKISHVFNSEEKCKAFLKFVNSKMSAESRHAELEKELTEVLEHILRGLENLSLFLDAVEKLAVTSLHIFTENQVLHLPEGVTLGDVKDAIITAQQICPLLLEFKRDNNVFFLPKLHNVDVLKYQLDRYIQTSQKIYKNFENSSIRDISLVTLDVVVDLNVDLCDDNIQSMLHHIYHLEKIRMDPNFRLMFLFKESSCLDFIGKFDEQQPRMLEFLNELEQCALKLDKLSKGVKISSVAGSSVGAVGSVLSIVGLALIPVTAGVSFGLTMAGVGLGLTSALNSAVTTGAEIGVNQKHQTKAGEVFQKFTEDVKGLQAFLQDETNQHICQAEVCQSEDLTTNTDTLVAQEAQTIRNVPRVASDIPEISEAAIKGSLAASRSARAGFIAVNALFLGMDIFFICKDSVSLAKGIESKVSQLIRARATLWSSEMNSWQKIHDSLKKGLLTSERNKKILEASFYPEMKKQRISEIEAHSSIHYNNHVISSVIQYNSFSVQRFWNLSPPWTGGQPIAELKIEQLFLIVTVLVVFLWFILKVCDAAFFYLM
ncbi:uncharacterized protein LOC116317941 [Oreochromis aureus]|uniref:Uncharacterized protein n=1 Tax=Oreochromis aureus TaxID=47969 RepID=A0AAZ1WYS2_OREAU|nr:uncharacterized protein LOC116317941 [Oreochromis aureus]XP_039467581.1 uncharacterized protein LOC116317941 [Oreochromis aureus]